MDKKTHSNRKWITACAAAMLFVATAQAQDKVTVTDRPLVSTSSNYTNFRAPLRQAPLLKLPVGQVQPRGWLRKYLELQRDGLNGKLNTISAWLDKNNNQWLSDSGDHGWEEVPYWLRGYCSLAYILDDEDMKKEFERVLESRGFSKEEAAAAATVFTDNSLDLVDLVMSLEDEFGIEVPDEQVENFRTVGDVVPSDYPPMSPDWKLDVLKAQVRSSVERIDEYRGILHIRRHLAATPLFKGIPNFRELRIAMLRATTVNELFELMEQVRPLVREHHA